MRHGLVCRRCYKNSAFRLLIAVYGMVAMQGVVAQFEDPTLPPDMANVIVEKEDESRAWKLSSILVSPQRNVAIINGHSVQVGDTLDGATVRSIKETVVTLDYRGKFIQLQLYPVAIKTVREK